MSKGLSQEKLSELSGCHPTYIGQIERGEKNATIESIAKISAALEIPLSKLFEQLGEEENAAKSIPLECYEFISSKSPAQQKQILRILMEIDKYKGN
jgi:transcriptional regulator with XRE-family HTH domain